MLIDSCSFGFIRGSLPCAVVLAKGKALEIPLGIEWEGSAFGIQGIILF